MDRSKIKTKAKSKLSLCIGAIIIQYLVIGLLALCIGFLVFKIKILSMIFPILLLLFLPPLALGISYSIYRIYNDSTVNPFLFLGITFRYFSMAWKLAFRRFLACIPELLLLMGSTILMAICFFSRNLSLLPVCQIISLICQIALTMKLYYYFFLEYTFFDNPESSSKVLMLKTKKTMLGNRLQLFLLQLSFLPLHLLGILPTFLLGLINLPGLAFLIINGLLSIIMSIYEIWLTLYSQFSIITFYKELIKPKDTKKSPYDAYTQKDVYEATAVAESSYVHHGFDTDKNINNIKKENLQKQQESFNDLDFLEALNSSDNEFDTFDVADPKDNNKK